MLDSEIAKRLAAAQVIVITRAAVTAICRAVNISLSQSLFAFLPWQFEPVIEANKTEWDNVLLRVRLEKNVQVIPGFLIPIKSEFFIPFRLVSALGFGLENQRDERSGPLLVLTNQEPYVTPTATTTA